MGRFSDSTAQAGVGPAAFTNATMVNALTSGYFGYTANIARYVDNAGFRQQQLRCFVLETPGAIRYLDHPDLWHGAIKAMMEKQTRTITGFQRALTVDDFIQPAGGAGAEQHDPGNVTQQQPEPIHEVGEKYGFPVGTMLEWWIRLFIMDPDAKRPLIMTYPNPPTDLLPDMISMQCLYVESDPTGLEVVNAYLGVNMRPKTSGTRESRFDKSQGAADWVHNIGFTGTFIMNLAVDKLATQLLKDSSILNANPYTVDLPSEMKTITADVQAIKAGYAQDVANAQGSQVSL